MKYFFITLLCFAAQADNLTPGYWHSKADFKLNGLPMPSSEDDSCVTAEEAKDPKKTIEDSLKRNQCSLKKWELKKVNVSATVACKNDQYEAEGSLKGTFDKKSYDLSGNIKGHHQFLGNANAEVHFTGKWTGECPKPKKN